MLKVALLADVSWHHGHRLAEVLGKKVDLLVISQAKPIFQNGYHCETVIKGDQIPTAYLSRGSEYAKLLDDFCPDIIHAQNIGVHAVFAHEYGKTPFISSVLGSDLYMLESRPAPIKERIKKALRAAKIVTADSLDLVKLLGFYDVSVYRQAYWSMGVDTKLFRKVDDRQCSNLKIENHFPVILSGRRLGSLYQHELIIEAFALLIKDYPEALLVFVGNFIEKEYQAKIMKLIEDLKLARSVRFVPAQPFEALPFVYNIADVWVSAAKSDGTPVSLLEAMACRVPVLASDLPSIREIVEFPRLISFDPSIIAERINEVLTCDHAYLEEELKNNQEMVQSEFDQEKQVQKLIGFYKDILAGRESALKVRSEFHASCTSSANNY